VQPEVISVPSQPPLMNVSDVAHDLSCSRSFVYALIRSGDLPVVKLGRLTRVPRNGLDAFLQRDPPIKDSEPCRVTHTETGYLGKHSNSLPWRVNSGPISCCQDPATGALRWRHHDHGGEWWSVHLRRQRLPAVRHIRGLKIRIVWIETVRRECLNERGDQDALRPFAESGEAGSCIKHGLVDGARSVQQRGGIASPLGVAAVVERQHRALGHIKQALNEATVPQLSEFICRDTPPAQRLETPYRRNQSVGMGVPISSGRLRCKATRVRADDPWCEERLWNDDVRLLTRTLAGASCRDRRRDGRVHEWQGIMHVTLGGVADTAVAVEVAWIEHTREFTEGAVYGSLPGL